MPSTSVQAELQMPSMTTRSPRSRIFANLILYSSTRPPWSRVMRYSAFDEVAESNRKASADSRIKSPQRRDHPAPPRQNFVLGLVVRGARAKRDAPHHEGPAWLSCG